MRRRVIVLWQVMMHRDWCANMPNSWGLRLGLTASVSTHQWARRMVVIPSSSPTCCPAVSAQHRGNRAAPHAPCAPGFLFMAKKFRHTSWCLQAPK